jgi:serine/threonine protein kinase
MGAITRIGKFQILGTLGKGAHSTILHVRRSADSKQYALKVVPIHGSGELKFLEQAQHEFRVARMLDHPNLLHVYALETPRDWLFRIRKVHMLLEYVNGQTLDKFPRIPMPKLVQVFERVAAALTHMHRRGVYHADLKPNNVLLSHSGVVKVIDFGLAWIKGQDKGRIQGTPEYMAPEQVHRGLVNESTDIFNFGATMYRLVTWRNPPTLMDPGAGLSVKVDAEMWKTMLKPVEECNAEAPRALAELIHRCLAYSANERPERMSEVKEALTHQVKKLVRAPEDRLEAFEW